MIEHSLESYESLYRTSNRDLISSVAPYGFTEFSRVCYDSMIMAVMGMDICCREEKKTSRYLKAYYKTIKEYDE